jgi:glycosyltransferase involved in cell wall biosynthesis
LICSRPVTDPEVRAAVSSIVELDFPDPPRLPPRRWQRRLWDIWLAIGAREPREVAGMAVVRRALSPEVARARPGVLLVEYAGLAGLPLPTGVIKVLTLHNIGSVMAAQAAAVDGVGRRRWLWLRDAAKWTRWQRRIVQAYDRVITVSQPDAAALAAAHVAVVPNGVDSDRFRPTPLPSAPAMVFTGALYTPPNIDGISWFCREVLPLVHRRVPSATLTIAGLSPPPEVRRLADLEGVEVHPDVDDTVPFLAAARLAVVPLRIGSGSRLKILEAMAAGRPVVSTTIGAEGLDVEPGRHLTVADSADAFAAAACAVLEGGGEATAAAARELVEREYAWPVVADRFVRAVLGAEPA